MKRTSLGLIIAVVAAFTFGSSGPLVKPLLEAGWSPAAAVMVRALVGGLVLLPVALVLLRGKWDAVRRGRWRILAMALVGVAGTQLVYFAAVQRVPVSTAILMEYMAPVLLVLFVWVRSRRMPRAVVIAGSLVAVAGLVLVVSPGGAGSFDPLGLLFGAMAMVGCAIYFVLAAKPSDGLPPIAFACFGLLGGGLSLLLVGLLGIVPFTATFGEVAFLGSPAPWWVPLLIVGVVATAIAYATSITSSEMLGSRVASFAGLLEVVAGALYAWLLLGENLTVPQLLGGVLILGGIALVRSEKTSTELEAGESAPPTTPVTAAQQSLAA
jgi:drug/metabolite transporter (DMT)-like permease